MKDHLRLVPDNLFPVAVTIPAGETDSIPLDCAGFAVAAVITPATCTGTAAVFLAGATAAEMFQAISEGAVQINIPLVGSFYYALSQAGNPFWLGAPFVSMRSNATEAADRSFTIMLRKQSRP
jgi:hypothetical protein